MKQLNITERILDWLLFFIADKIPETSKRYVLYELQSRVILKNVSWNDDCDEWKITFKDMYTELKD